MLITSAIGGGRTLVLKSGDNAFAIYYSATSFRVWRTYYVLSEKNRKPLDFFVAINCEVINSAEHILANTSAPNGAQVREFHDALVFSINETDRYRTALLH